jgi:MFS family permease
VSISETAIPTGHSVFGSAMFRRVFACRAVSSLGDGMDIVALPLLVGSSEAVDFDPWRMALVVVFNRIPVILATLAGAGAWVDRSDARRVLLICDGVRFLGLAALGLAALGGRPPLFLVYVAAFILGAFESVHLSAMMRIIPSTVNDAQLPTANGRLSTVTTIGEQFAGPALAGVLSAAGRAIPTLIDAVSFLVSATISATLPNHPPAITASQAKPRTLLAEGFRWFRANKIVRTPTLLIMSAAFGQSMTVALLVARGKELGLSTSAVGFFIGAVAIGNLIGGLVVDRVINQVSVRKLIMGGMAVSAVAYVIAGGTDSVVITVLAMIAEGILIIMTNVAFVVHRQRVVPKEFVGRVQMIVRGCIYGVTPFGAITGGLFARHYNVAATFRLAGIVVLVSTMIGARPLRRAMRPTL